MLKAIVFSAVLIALASEDAPACTCVPPTVEEARRHADAIFLGTVKSVTFLEPNSPGSRVIVEFSVDRVWKGPVTKEFQMRSIVETTFCEGFFREDLVVGKQLLVFANRVLSGLRYTYSTNICTLTGPPDRYANTVRQLGEAKPPK
jgi:hypothetical protein